jgi:hypothetical protein
MRAHIYTDATRSSQHASSLLGALSHHSECAHGEVTRQQREERLTRRREELSLKEAGEFTAQHSAHVSDSYNRRWPCIITLTFYLASVRVSSTPPCLTSDACDVNMCATVNSHLIECI